MLPNSLLNISPELVKKYAVSGPRYTSYPTAVEFTSELDTAKWLEVVEQDLCAPEAGASASLYFHLPFCHTLCYFCACNKVISRDPAVLPPYLNAVYRELESYRRLLSGRVPPIEQLHWGGGSPNCLTPDQMKQLQERTRDCFPQLTPDADVSAELDPRTTTAAQIKALAAGGFNRMSLGVQDFNPAVQEAINRIQPYEMTRDLVTSCRNAGIGGINIDLIYGLPLQTADNFRHTVDKIIELRPDRIALYGYAHVTWLKKVQKTLEREHLPTPDERIAIFIGAMKAFLEAGYVYIGLDHFALPGDTLAIAQQNGKLNRNFMGYTTHKGARMYSFGVSSISMLPGGFAQNVKEVPRYQQLIETTGFAVERGINCSREDRLRWEVIESMMCQCEIDIRQIEQRWQIDFFEHFREGIERLAAMAADGLVAVDRDWIRLTPPGRLFARNVAMEFDAYLPQHRAQENKVFSQAV